MGMFGQSLRSRRTPEEEEMGPEYAPTPGPYDMAPNVAGMIPQGVDPRLTAPMPKKRGLFGGAGKVLGGIADVLTYGPFVGRARENREYRRRAQDAEIEKEYAQAEKLRREATQSTYQNVAGVGLVKVNPDGTTEVAMAAQDDPATAPAGVREWEYMQTLPPEMREQFRNFRQPVPYQYTEPGIEAAGEIARVRLAAKPPASAAPKYEYRMGPNGQLQKRRVG